MKDRHPTFPLNPLPLEEVLRTFFRLRRLLSPSCQGSPGQPVPSPLRKSESQDKLM